MLETSRGTRGMVVAPHHLAAQAGLRVLRDGGNAVEAMVAAAATIAVVYPHMNGLGGDCFWLIHDGGKVPVAIDACGAAARLADMAFYKSSGLGTIPSRGPLAALTVAGAVSGWSAALDAAAVWGPALPLERLFEDAVYYARHGMAVTRAQANDTVAKEGEMGGSPGFAEHFLPGGSAPLEGNVFSQPAMAETLERLARDGLDGFYRGALGADIAADLEAAGSPLRWDDLEDHRARVVTPLSLRVKHGTLFNMPPPTQGVASLIILGLYERLGAPAPDTFAFVHALVEASKQAFQVRDCEVTDPAFTSVDPARYLDAARLDRLAAAVDRKRAMAFGGEKPGGDTVWLGAIDGEGRAVSFIQSLYWEFGSGVVLPQTGITWQNRGTSFSLDAVAVNPLMPGRRPFHTIQPALAMLSGGRIMPYGTMGGEGQPQTQAMIYARYVVHGMGLQAAVTAPRWLLGRTWGAETTNLRIENRFDDEVIANLRNAGHDIDVVGPFDAVMGHAGALVRHASGVIEGASDPRSDGGVAAF